MKIPYAARFATITFLFAALYMWLQMRPGLHTANDIMARQSWVLAHAVEWNLGWWLWLFAIFSWMVLLVTLSWTYLPAHRIAGSLQSGLMIIGAVLAIAGINIWMMVLPFVFAQTETAPQLIPVIDTLALALLGSGCMMAGVTTVWIAYDLIQQRVLSRPWLLIAMISGLCTLLAPMLGFHLYLLLIGFFCWLTWCLWLSTRQRMPSPFPNWPEA